MHFIQFTLFLGFAVFALADNLNTLCMDFHLDESLSYVLSALCVDDTGRNTSTLLDLDACIANDEGQLVWRMRSITRTLSSSSLTYESTRGGFAESCNAMRIDLDSTNSPLLEANCTEKQGQRVTNLSLDGGITVVRGVLACKDELSTVTASATSPRATASLVTSTSLLTSSVLSTSATVMSSTGNR